MDGILENTEDGTYGAFHLGYVLTFPRILLRVTFFRIGLAGVVSSLVSFRTDIMYALAWSSVGLSGEASALEALNAADSVFSTCFSTAAAMELFLFGRLLYHSFVRPLLLGFLSRHLKSSSFWYLNRVAYYGGFSYWRWTPVLPIPALVPKLDTSTFEVPEISLDPCLLDVIFLAPGSYGRRWIAVDTNLFLFTNGIVSI